MADMSITLNKRVGEVASKPTPTADITFTCSSSYPTGGYALDLGSYIDRADTVTSRPINIPLAAAPTYLPFYNVSTGKLQVFVVATGAEVANAVDLSAVSFELLILGA